MYKIKKATLGEARKCMEEIMNNIGKQSGRELYEMAEASKKVIEAVRKKEKVKLDALKGGKDEYSIRALDMEDKIDIMGEIIIYIMDIMSEVKKPVPKADLIYKRAEQAARNIAVLQS